MFSTIIRFTLSAFISSRTETTVLYCSKTFGSLESRTSSCKSAFFASSRVDLKAFTRECGRFEIKPTVSVRRIEPPSFKLSLLVVGSRVAKSLSSTKTSAPVSALSRVDFPAFV